jgi:N-acetylneuraminate synthase
LIGYSDHTLPDEAMTSLITAYLLGSVIIEKHFTHDKKLPGNDHYHAMDVNDLKRYSQMIARVGELLGNEEKKIPIETEEISRKNARRSIVMSQQVSSGTVLEPAMLTYKRPGTGISPLHWDAVLGMKAAKDLAEDHVLTWADISPVD